MQSAPGVRFTLRLEHADSSVVRYGADIEQTDGTVHGSVEVALANGTVSVDAGAAVEDWVTDRIRAVVRAEWRSRQAAGSAPWLRRIARWRPAP